MLFEWDPIKAEGNLKKHGISFELAQSVFDDPQHLSLLDAKIPHEERWITIGLSADARTLVVVHTYVVMESNHELIRIISARKATRKERLEYEKRI